MFPSVPSSTDCANALKSSRWALRILPELLTPTIALESGLAHVYVHTRWSNIHQWWPAMIDWRGEMVMRMFLDSSRFPFYRLRTTSRIHCFKDGTWFLLLVLVTSSPISQNPPAGVSSFSYNLSIGLATFREYLASCAATDLRYTWPPRTSQLML